MMTRQTAKALCLLGVASVVGGLAQQALNDESTELGLSKIELSLIGAGLGALVRRRVRKVTQRKSGAA